MKRITLVERRRPPEKDRTGSRRQVVAGRYRVERVLGQGSAAVVYEVVDMQTCTRRALKLLMPPKHRRVLKRTRLAFRREFHTLANLRHPNIVEVHDFGVDQGRLYYTMELLDGDQQITGRIAPLQVCRLIRDVASALAFLHARRLIHGDISRRNVGCDGSGTMKVLDFGLLATVGVPGMGRGTLPYMAPEVYWGLPLDHRVDLFSLGALAYRLLTERYAYCGSRTGIDQAWTERPLAPTQLDADLPRELSDLVLSMVSVDPLGRPSSAAEIIDRVQAIAQLPPLSEGEVVRGYLASSTLIGRAKEMRTLRQAVANARRGQGSAVVIRGPSGMGKTRILEELGVEAQLAGARVLSTRCRARERTSYSAFHRLLSPLLKDGMGERTEDPLKELVRWAGGDKAAEERLATQRRLATRLLAEADKRPLVVLVDDLQRGDEASITVLAAIAHQACSHRVVVVSTLRTDEPQSAPAAVAAVARGSLQMRLGGLGADEVEQLLQAIFGDVDNLRRLAQWIHDCSDGSPLGCTELARLLVDRGTVVYEDGMWRIPLTLDPLELPGALVEAMERRVEVLTPPARQLAEALSVHGGEMGLEMCVDLMGDATGSEATTFALLDELVAQEVLVGTGGRLRFRHDGLREALLRRLTSERRRSLHLRVGRMLDAAGVSKEQVGWHLLQGGEELRAADMLESAGLRHFEAQAYTDAAPCLEAALGVLDRHRAPRRRRVELGVSLVRAGLMWDRQLVLKYGDRVVSELADDSGITLACRLRPVLGYRFALILAVLVVCFRWPFRRPNRRGLFPILALPRYAAVVNYITVVKAVSFDLDGARAMTRQLDPIWLALRGGLGEAAHQFGSAFVPLTTGRLDEARRRLERYLQLVGSSWRRLGPQVDYELGVGSARFLLGLIGVLQFDQRSLDQLQRMESTNFRFFEVSAKFGRLLHHRLRGEEQRARVVEEEVKLLFVQMGSMWIWESLLCWMSAFCYCATQDLTALRRSIGELEGWKRSGLRFEPVIRLCQGVYQFERGELDRALATLTALAESPACRDNPLFQAACFNGLAGLHNAMGRPEEAAAVMRKRDPRSSVKPIVVVGDCNLATARGMLGETEKARRFHDELFKSSRDNPLLCGTLHEQRTILSLASREMEWVRHHLAETEYWFRITRNPALVARYEKLAAKVGEQMRTRRGSLPDGSVASEHGTWSEAAATCEVER